MMRYDFHVADNAETPESKVLEVASGKTVATFGADEAGQRAAEREAVRRSIHSLLDEASRIADAFAADSGETHAGDDFTHLAQLIDSALARADALLPEGATA